MTYAIGEHIDLTYLNKKQQECVAEPQPSRTEAAFDVGTQLLFRLVNGHLTTARKIEVAFA